MSKCVKHLEQYLAHTRCYGSAHDDCFSSARLSLCAPGCLSATSPVPALTQPPSLCPSLHETHFPKPGRCVCLCRHWGGRGGPSCCPSGDPALSPRKTVSPTPTPSHPVPSGCRRLLPPMQDWPGTSSPAERGGPRGCCSVASYLRIWSKSLNLSVPQFPLLENRGHKGACLLGSF